ncbi:MAG: ABC transporter substrate-binding protein [Aerococcus sp.]|nr:ABC transporter substrate-binding protein [Aerococcus sp.]
MVEGAHDIIAGKADKSTLGIKAIDDKTLEVKYENPYPYAKDILSMSAFYPINEKFYNDHKDNFGMNADNALYNGPYVLKDWDGTGLTWKLEKN